MKKLATAIIFAFVSLSLLAQDTGSNWKMQYVRVGEGMESVGKKQSKFVISIKEKKFTGSIGCNQFQGKLEYSKGNHIKPIKMVNLKAKCPQELDKLENAAIIAINMADKLVIDQDKAKFYNGERLVLELTRL